MNIRDIEAHYYALGTTTKEARWRKPAAIGALLAPLAASPLVMEAPTQFTNSILDRVMGGYASLGEHLLPAAAEGVNSNMLAGLGSVSALGAALGAGIGEGAHALRGARLPDMPSLPSMPKLPELRLRERFMDKIERAAIEALQRDAVKNALRSEIQSTSNAVRSSGLAGLAAGGAVGGLGGYLAGRSRD